MESSVFNLNNYKVEQLVDRGSSATGRPLFYIAPGGNAPLALNYSNGFFQIRLEPMTRYVINRIRCQVYFFMDEAGGGFAYPRWEQFAIGLSIDAFLSDANLANQRQLFKNFTTNITDGITESVIYCEPFVFDTSVTSGEYLHLVTNGDRSFFTQLSNIIIPPPAGLVGVSVIGTVILEGCSYSLVADQVNKNRIEVRSQGTSVDVENVIEADI